MCTETVYTVFDIANWFLNKDSKYHLDDKKLQKLCYYAQVWGIVFNGRPMINDKFEAWVHGPVNRQLWNELKYYGYADVPANELENEAKPINDQAVMSVLNDVWETYKDFSGYELELLTHQEAPWIKARVGLMPEQPSNNPISENDMRDFYSKLVSQDGVNE